jgi:zinc transporter ZupT
VDGDYNDSHIHHTGDISCEPYLIDRLKDVLIPVTAGGFIYIALVDLIPELHRRKRGGKFLAQVAMIGMGLLLMWWLKKAFEH